MYPDNDKDLVLRIQYSGDTGHSGDIFGISLGGT